VDQAQRQMKNTFLILYNFRGNPSGQVFKRLYHHILLPAKYFVLVLGVYLLTAASSAYAQENMAIGVATPDLSAQLHLQSSGKGLLIPRLTANQRGLIVGPATGLLVYETSTNRFYFNEGNPINPTWRYLLTQADLPATNAWQLTGNAFASPNYYLGTSNATNLVLRINGKQVGIFPSSHAGVKLGLEAGRLANGSGIIALGNNALAKSTSLRNLIAIGDSALHHFAATSTYPTYQTGNVIAIGGRAAMSGSNQTNLYEHNVAVGYGALSGIAGQDNVAIGYYALANGIAGGSMVQFNVAVGWRALGNLATGLNNTAIGYRTGDNLEAGNNNTFLGYNANVPAYTNNTITNATAIGNLSLVSTSNTMAFGNSSCEFFLFGQSGPTLGGVAFQVNQYTGGNNPYLSKTGTWNNLSDSTSKTNIKPIDDNELWHQVKNLPVTEWQYKGDNALHIGPMAQDFHQQLQLGDDDKAISTADPAGVALATLQILIKKNKELKARIEVLEQRSKW